MPPLTTLLIVSRPFTPWITSRSRRGLQLHPRAELPYHRLVLIRLQALLEVLQIVGAPVGTERAEQLDGAQPGVARLFHLALLDLRGGEQYVADRTPPGLRLGKPGEDSSAQRAAASACPRSRWQCANSSAR